MVGEKAPPPFKGSNLPTVVFHVFGHCCEPVAVQHLCPVHLSLQKLALALHRLSLISRHATLTATGIAARLSLIHNLPTVRNLIVGLTSKRLIFSNFTMIFVTIRQFRNPFVNIRDYGLVGLKIAVGLQIVVHRRTAPPLLADGTQRTVVNLTRKGIEKSQLPMIIDDENTPHLPLRGTGRQVALQLTDGSHRQRVGNIMKRIVERTVVGQTTVEFMEKAASHHCRFEF